MARLLRIGAVVALTTGFYPAGAADPTIGSACSPQSAGGSCAAAGDHLLLQVGRQAVTRRGDVELSTFFWNVHWECSFGERGASGACRQRIGERFAELAKASAAQVVASIELQDSITQASSLANFGLWGWTQVNGPCAAADYGDMAALAFAPEWEVLNSGGGCLRNDADTRAFAVAKVRPPTAVQGCPSLCILAVHAPHTWINHGRDIVQSVCAEAVQQCVVAMGDWNTPASGVQGLWDAFIGGLHPAATVPDERTCCFPESSNYGVFDHIATNIPGARSAGATVHPYQLLELNPVKQHRPVSARLALPGAGPAFTA